MAQQHLHRLLSNTSDALSRHDVAQDDVASSKVASTIFNTPATLASCDDGRFRKSSMLSRSIFLARSRQPGKVVSSPSPSTNLSSNPSGRGWRKIWPTLMSHVPE